MTELDDHLAHDAAEDGVEDLRTLGVPVAEPRQQVLRGVLDEQHDVRRQAVRDEILAAAEPADAITAVTALVS